MADTYTDAADLKGIATGGLIREDVMNKIWDISKVPLPLTDMIGTDSSSNDYKEWTQDSLAAPDITNAVIDGAAAGSAIAAGGARIGNHHQISEKVVKVSHRADASNTIGYTKALAYQIMRRQQELKRDVEATMMVNQASVASVAETTAGKSAGIPAWLTTNAYHGAGAGADGGFSSGIVAARTLGTARGLTETLVRTAVQAVYEEGGDPSIMMSVPGVIGNFSTYLFSSSARVATLMSDQGKSSEAATAVGAVNVFVTDFGTLKLVPNRLQQSYTSSAVADVFILDPSYLSLSYLQNYRTDELGKTGATNDRQMTVDWSLVVGTEKAHAAINDITIATAVVA